MSKYEILIEPFERKRYIHHRNKVRSAGPAIDNQSPKERKHIVLNLKKQLQEGQRQLDIQMENFRLLQQLNRIMEVNRLDNNWNKPQYTTRWK